MKVERNKLKKIADDVVVGTTVFFNPKTSEFKKILFDENGGIANGYDQEWEAVKQWENEIKLTCMERHKLLRAMEDFAYTVEDVHLQDKLLTVLKLKSPVYNFREIVKNSQERESWYNYILLKEMENVKTQLELEDIEVEE